MVLCSAVLIGLDVQVKREDDAVIFTVGKISYRMVLCSAYIIGVDVQVKWEDDAGHKGR